MNHKNQYNSHVDVVRHTREEATGVVVVTEAVDTAEVGVAAVEEAEEEAVVLEEDLVVVRAEELAEDGGAVEIKVVSEEIYYRHRNSIFLFFFRCM